jgi:predicted ABC-type sugar transport system permease subunit
MQHFQQLLYRGTRNVTRWLLRNVSPLELAAVVVGGVTFLTGFGTIAGGCLFGLLLYRINKAVDTAMTREGFKDE